MIDEIIFSDRFLRAVSQPRVIINLHECTIVRLSSINLCLGKYGAAKYQNGLTLT
jgi:hypothetical protein